MLEKCQDLEEFSANAIVPFYNRSSEDYDCVPILERGPCDLNYRVVINRLTGICELDPCAALNTNELKYVMYDQECQEIGSNICANENEILVIDEYGVGECYCSEPNLLFEEPGGTLTCYKRQATEPCPEGQCLLEPEYQEYEDEDAPIIYSECKESDLCDPDFFGNCTIDIQF